MYNYKAKITRVVDGDTFDVVINGRDLASLLRENDFVKRDSYDPI